MLRHDTCISRSASYVIMFIRSMCSVRAIYGGAITYYIKTCICQFDVSFRFGYYTVWTIIINKSWKVKQLKLNVV